MATPISRENGGRRGSRVTSQRCRPIPLPEGIHPTCFHGASGCTGLCSSAFIWQRDQHMQNPETGDSRERLRDRKAAVVKYYEQERHTGVRPRRGPRARSHGEVQARLTSGFTPCLKGRRWEGFE